MGVRCVMHVRELPQEDTDLCIALENTPAQLRSKALIEAAHYVANSQAVADWLNTKSTVISPITVPPALFEIDSLPQVPLRIGLVGNLINKKGIGDVMMVAKAVKDAGHLAEFRLIGPDTRDLQALRPWPDNLVHLGYLNTPQEAMEAVDVVLSLSHFAESFGRTVFEAMAAGRPVICYNRGTPPSILGASLSDFICPADTPKAVAEALAPLIENRADYMKVSKRMRQRARELQKQNQSTDLSQIFGTSSKK
jgi:glycosyltransferase involved in cell wall biosynthesis